MGIRSLPRGKYSRIHKYNMSDNLCSGLIEKVMASESLQYIAAHPYQTVFVLDSSKHDGLAMNSWIRGKTVSIIKCKVSVGIPGKMQISHCSAETARSNSDKTADLLLRTDIGLLLSFCAVTSGVRCVELLESQTFIVPRLSNKRFIACL